MAEELLADSPQSIGRVLDIGTRLYTSSFKNVVGLSLGAYFLMALAPMGLILLGSEDVADGAPAAGGIAALIVAIVVAIAAYIAGIGLYFGALIRQWRFANGELVEAGDAFRAGLRLIPRAFGAGLLWVLACVVGFILLIVPGIYLSIALGFFYVILVTENAGAIESLKRSLRLVRGNWWRTATIVTIPIFIIVAISVVVIMVPVFFLAFEAASNGVEPGLGVELTTNVLSALVNGLTVPWMTGVALTIYRDLHLRAEGSDLENRMAALDAQQ